MITPNVTVQSDDIFASVEHQNGRYLTGCFGLLQQNQSDLIATESLYPTIGQNLTNGPVLHADKMAFLSMYKDQFPVRYADIMQSFHAFSAKVWIMIMLSAMFMMFMISCSNFLAKSQRTAMRKWAEQKRWLAQQDKGNAWRGPFASRKMTAKHRFGEQLANMLVSLFNSSIKRSFTRTNRNSLSVATLTLMLIIMSFYVSFFFRAIVKTEKVTRTKPPTIETYDDILQSYPAKWPAFFRNLNSHLPFTKADAGSKEWKIWQNAKRTGLNKSLISDVFSDKTSFARSDIIYFAPGNYISFISCYYCNLRKQLELKTIPMGKSDDSAKENLFIFLLSGHLQSAIAARLMQVFGRLLPAGFAQYLLGEAYHDNWTTFEDFDVCLSNVIRFPDQKISGISLDQCMKLIVTVICMSVSSGIILVIEFLFRRTKG